MTLKGQVFGKYQLHTRIAATSVSEVWAGREQAAGMLAKHVAVKILSAQASADPAFVKLFLAEAQRAATLTHQHIAQTRDLNEREGRYYIVTELVPGETLAAVVAQLGSRHVAFPVRLALTLAFQACQVLHDAHTRTDHLGQPLGIIHTGLHPRNMILSFGGMLKVTDSGTSGAITRVPTLRAAVDPVRYAYMSPEQCMNTPVDLRTDVFSLGVVVWELLAGQRLFQGDTEFTLKQAVALTQAAPLTSVRGDVSPSLNVAIARALEKNPADRWSSAADLGRALQNALQPLGGAMPPDAVAGFMAQLFPDRLADWQAIVGQSPERDAAARSTVAPSPPSPVLRSPTETSKKPPLQKTAPAASGPPDHDDDTDLSFDDEDDEITFREGSEATLADLELPAGLAAHDEGLAELWTGAEAAPPATAEGQRVGQQQSASPSGSDSETLEFGSQPALDAASDLGQTGDDPLAPSAPTLDLPATTAAREPHLLAKAQGPSGQQTGATTTTPADLEERPDTGAPPTSGSAAPSPGRLPGAQRHTISDGYEPDPWTDDPDEEQALCPEFRITDAVDTSPGASKRQLGQPVVEILRHRGGHLVGSATLRRKARPFAQRGSLAVGMGSADAASLQVGASASGQIKRADGSSEAARPNMGVVLRLGDRAELVAGDESWIVRVYRPPKRPRGFDFEVSLIELAVAIALSSIFIGGMAIIVQKAEESGILVKVEKPQEEKFADARRRKVRSLKPKKKRPKIKIKKLKPKKQPRKKTVKKEKKPKPPEPKPEIKPPDPTEAQPKITNKQRDKIAKLTKAKYDGKTKKEKVKTMFKTPNQGAASTFKTATTSIQSVKAKNKSGAFRVAGDEVHVPGGEVRLALDAGGGGKGPVTKGGPAATRAVPKLAQRAKPKKVRGKVRGLRAAARISGQLSRAEVLKAIGKHMGAIRRCYEKQLMAKPNLAGKITAQWTVTSAGRVSGARQKTSTIGDSKVSSCMLKVIRRMKFPKPKGGAVKITYPFIFRSAS